MPRKPRHLSPEETRLWERVVEKTEAMRPQRVVTLPFAPKTPAKKPTAAPVRLEPFQLGQKSTGTAATIIDRKPGVADRVAAAAIAMDRKAHRKLKRGKLKPEARIDLHGMTLAQAHPALIGFIQRAYGNGLRLVLVITGKGRGGRDRDGPIPERRGILRDQVPGWLSSGPCRSCARSPYHRFHYLLQ